MEGGVGPTAASHSHSHSRPVRSSSRNLYSSNTNSFTGPVRRWQKKWVHVSSSPPSIPKRLPKSNVSNPSNNNNNNKPILLCKWTPLSDMPSPHLPPRKFRYTPIAVFEEQKKLASKRVEDKDQSDGAHQSGKKLAVDADDIFGMLDINQDLMEEYEEGEKGSTTHTSYSSQFNLD